jgi:hypothetical protein
MTYHLKPVTTHQRAASAYDGLHLSTSRLRLSQRFDTRVGSARRVRLSYDPQARMICLMPSPTQTGPAGPDLYRLSRGARGEGFIYCATRRAVMPAGRYRFVCQTRDGYLCTHAPTRR